MPENQIGETLMPQVTRREIPWRHWFLVVLYANLAVGVLQALAAGLSNPVFSYIAQAIATGQFWLQPSVFISLLVSLGLPVLLLISTVQCIRFRESGRMYLLIYCWCVLGLLLMRLGAVAYNSIGYMVSSLDGLGYLVRNVYSVCNESIMPLITLLAITRPPVKELFSSPPRGFEVIS